MTIPLAARLVWLIIASFLRDFVANLEAIGHAFRRSNMLHLSTMSKSFGPFRASKSCFQCGEVFYNWEPKIQELITAAAERAKQS